MNHALWNGMPDGFLVGALFMGRNTHVAEKIHLICVLFGELNILAAEGKFILGGLTRERGVVIISSGRHNLISDNRFNQTVTWAAQVVVFATFLRRSLEFTTKGCDEMTTGLESELVANLLDRKFGIA